MQWSTACGWACGGEAPSVQRRPVTMEWQQPKLHNDHQYDSNASYPIQLIVRDHSFICLWPQLWIKPNVVAITWWVDGFDHLTGLLFDELFVLCFKDFFLSTSIV